MFDTRIAVIVRADLAVWQKLNVTAFTVSGVAATQPEVIGEPYEDGSGNRYLPMLGQPVFIYSTDAAGMRTVYERALRREVPFALFTEELFATGNDVDNRAALRAVAMPELNVVGMALRAEMKLVDKILKGVARHD